MIKAVFLEMFVLFLFWHCPDPFTKLAGILVLVAYAWYSASWAFFSGLARGFIKWWDDTHNPPPGAA